MVRILDLKFGVWDLSEHGPGDGAETRLITVVQFGVFGLERLDRRCSMKLWTDFC